VAFSSNWRWTSLLEEELCWWFTAMSSEEKYTNALMIIKKAHFI